LLSFNPGESVKPLRKIASGGEISRIMLALKAIVSGIDNIITMIFDEIDTGIGGSTAIVVGRKLYSISGRCQVICITHLPQIAAFADDHFFISKTVEKERTKIMINRLSHDKVVKEIARMLSGLSDSDISFKHAVELLEETNRIKKYVSKGLLSLQEL
jgi:DNA repair protein RecN (Recombination protein N)